jgi:hypothetical protein
MKYLLLLIGFNSLFAQTVSYNFGNEFESINKYESFGLNKFNNGFYCLPYRKNAKEMTLQFFEKDFINPPSIKNFILPENLKKYKNEGFYSIGNNFFGLYSALERVDGKGKMERLFALSYNRENPDIVSAPINLLEVNEFATYHKYRFNYSMDSSKFLVTYVVAPKINNVRKNKDIIGFSLYDNKLKKMYSAEIEMPYTEFGMNNLTYSIDSKGEIYALIEANVDGNDINWDENTDKRNKISRRFEILKINKLKNNFESVKVTLDNNRVANSLTFSENKNKDLYLTGYYSNTNDFNLSIGAYVFGLKQVDNSEMTNSYITYCPFSIEQLKLNVENTKSQSDNIKPNNLKINKIIHNEDSSMILIGEEYIVGIGLNFSSNDVLPNTRSYQHVYCDIYVLKFDSRGNTLWSRRIPKSQSVEIESESGFYNGEQYRSDLSFCHHRYKNEDYFFYFDNLKNANLSLDIQPVHYASGDASYLSCVKLTSDGKMEKKAIFGLNIKDRRIHPSKFISISSSLIICNLLQLENLPGKILRVEIK